MKKLKHMTIDARFYHERGGIALYFRSLLWPLVRSLTDCHVTLVGQSSIEVPVDLQSRVSQILFRPMTWLPHFLGKIVDHLWRFPRVVAATRADLYWTPYYDTRLPSHKLMPSLMTIHDLCFWVLPECYSLTSKLWHRMVLSLNLRQRPYIVTISQTSKQRIQSTFGINDIRMAIVANIFTPRQAPLSPSVSKTQQILLYTGGVDARKNIPALLQAFVRASHGHNSWQLVITGGFGDHPIIQDAMAAIATEQRANIQFPPPMSYEELLTLYDQAQACVHFSLDEGFGRSLLEAAMSGLPIACSDIAIFREILAEQGAYYANPRDLDQMSQAITRAMLSPKKIPPTAVDPRYTLAHNLENLRKLIQHAMNVS